jgi:hypothetical protein
MTKLVWLDPSKENVNAGDEVIAEAIGEIGLPGLGTAARLTTHRLLKPRELKQLMAADVVIVGGTNILNSKLFMQRQWPLPPWQVAALRAKTVFVGVGWWQYQDGISAHTKAILRYISHPHISHAVRDSYTQQKLKAIGVESFMTSCPTLWNQHGCSQPGLGNSKAVVATITDYYFQPEIDLSWIRQLADRFSEVLVVGMGPGDQKVFDERIAGANINWAGYGMTALAALRTQTDVHIGTRLHAGVYWNSLGGSSVILAVDNRATEIAKDTGLRVVDRRSFDLDSVVAAGESGEIRLPVGAIEQWKRQWNSVVG